MIDKFSPNKYKKHFFEDDSIIISNRPSIHKIKIEKKLKRYQTPNKRRKIKNFSENLFEDNMIGNFKNEKSDKDSLEDTDNSTKSLKNNEFKKFNLKKHTSHSTNSLINMGEIEGSCEDKKRNISDDESEKINMEISKSNKKYLEKLKKDNIDFSNNLKNIFNNIGNIDPFQNDIIPEDNKEESELSLKTYIKSQNIRKVYYSKLLLNKVWKPINNSQRHNNLIIFDWDDTLLPTSFLLHKNVIDGDNKLSEKDQNKIKKLEQLVKKLLTLSLSKGDVYIITNAGEGWVEESTKKFYPEIKESIDQIEVISARKDYEEKYPDDTKLWKIGAFLNLKKRLNEDLITNILCLGDSVFEMEAGKILASNFIHAIIKTIKFMERPKPEELNKQLNLVLNQFNSIFSSYKNLTVRVEKKKK